LRDDMTILGRAMPVLEQDYDGTGPPFGAMFAALDSLGPGEVYVAAAGMPPYALWGELMSVRARKLGAAGAVLDGFARDTQGILELNFATFAAGRYAQDQAPRGRVVDYRCAVRIGEVTVRPGDLIFGDLDGVLVIPREAESEAIAWALEKASTENRVRAAMEGGMGAAEAFEKFGAM
jgi:4-hydroxy-4-methyl-2-oxoglutarate aldolase